MIFTKETILAEGIEAITEVDAADDISDGRIGQSWFEAQAADIMRELELGTDQVQAVEKWIGELYLGDDCAHVEEALNDLFGGKDDRKCLMLCRLLTAALYAQGDDRIRDAIEASCP